MFRQKQKFYNCCVVCTTSTIQGAGHPSITKKSNSGSSLSINSNPVKKYSLLHYQLDNQVAICKWSNLWTHLDKSEYILKIDYINGWFDWKMNILNIEYIENWMYWKLIILKVENIENWMYWKLNIVKIEYIIKTNLWTHLDRSELYYCCLLRSLCTVPLEDW